MSASHVSGRHARIDVTLDGISFTRSESDANRRATARQRQVGWDDVTGATVQISRKGRTVVRVAVVGAPEVEHHRDDPFAVKVPRKRSDRADEVVRHINAEVVARRRWREHAERAQGES